LNAENSRIKAAYHLIAVRFCVTLTCAQRVVRALWVAVFRIAEGTLRANSCEESFPVLLRNYGYPVARVSQLHGALNLAAVIRIDPVSTGENADKQVVGLTGGRCVRGCG